MRKRKEVRFRLDRQTRQRLGTIATALPRLSPDSAQEAADRLVQLAFGLHESKFFWPASALSAFLLGDSSTLEEALSLVPESGKGRKEPTEGEQLARAIVALRESGKSWKEVVAALNADERQLRRVHARWRRRLQPGASAAVRRAGGKG